MRLTKIVFNGQVSGIFGDSVSSLATALNPTVRHVESLEVTPLGLVVTKLDGAGRHLVPLHFCGTGDLADEEAATDANEEGAAVKPRGAKAKAR